MAFPLNFGVVVLSMVELKLITSIDALQPIDSLSDVSDQSLSVVSRRTSTGIRYYRY
eukprot:COSAG05_NODE_330_length_11274_cov_4.167696_6_plen_57_part_00